MKKVLYILLLLAELGLDFAVLSILWNSTFYIGVGAIVIIWAALLVWLFIKFKNADNEARKKKRNRRLVLVMAVPVILFIISVIGFIIGLSRVI